MPNIAAVLKEEIARIARKETRRQVDPLRKQLASQRREVAELKRERAGLKSQLKTLSRSSERAAPSRAEDAADAGSRRFSAAGLQALRGRLGVSAGDFGKLIGVSGQSVYNWEHGKSRPRPRQLERIASLRGVGKREAQARLDGAAAGPAGKKAAVKKTARKKSVAKKTGSRKAAARKPASKKAAAKKAARKQA